MISLDGAALYWDAPAPVEGDVEVLGTISSNNVDAPDGYPETRGVVRRVWMEWQDFTHQGGGTWGHVGGVARYEEVSATYLPANEEDARVESAAVDAVQGSFKRRLPIRWLRRRQPFTAAVFGSRVPAPLGATRTHWTGVLIDIEPTGTAHQ